MEALCEHLLREATGAATQTEMKLPAPTPATDEDDKPTHVESDVPQSEVEACLPFLSALDDSHVLAPSDEVAVAYGTLTWHWQPPAPNREGEAPAEPLVRQEPHPPAEPSVGRGSPDPAHELTEGLQSDETCGQALRRGQRPAPSVECVRRAFQRTRQGLEQFAQSRGVALRELHCTLLGLLLNTETGAVAVGHIGDGLVAMFHPGLGAQPLVDAPPR